MATIPFEGKLFAGALGGFAGWKLLDSQLGLGYDLGIVRRTLPSVISTARNLQRTGYGVATMWEENYAANRKRTAMIDADTGEQFTYQQVEDVSNQIANWAVGQKALKPGSCVAMYMHTSPFYVMVWLGLVKAGIMVAFLNNSIKGKPLVHSAKISGCVGILYDAEIAENVHNAAPGLREAGISVFGIIGDALPIEGGLNLTQQLPTFPTKPVNTKERRGHLSGANDVFGYIYTSGTTGLPKACRMTHMKMCVMGNAFLSFGVRPNVDVVYNSGLPAYHSSGFLGVMAMIKQGTTLIVRKRFSASKTWPDCIKYKATVMQYIGELCRYLLVPEPKPIEKQHSVRLAIGNGLRPEIWNTFQRRCNIPEIGEFYGATEANMFLFNHCTNYECQGAVGRSGVIMDRVIPFSIVKFDVENEVPVRDKKTGLCIQAANNEVGEAVAPIRMVQTGGGKSANFEGYTNKADSEKKILKDVFVKGDMYFRSGDLLRKDNGLTYFVDRIGDTFRWKGENVSTMEVSEVLSAYPGITEASVYGVKVPNADGRACMVALTLEEGVPLDAKKFADYCRAQLPSYSVPLFIRFIGNMSSTGTFKQVKGTYRNEGFDPAKCKDELWWFTEGTYKPLDAATFERIHNAGGSKL